MKESNTDYDFPMMRTHLSKYYKEEWNRKCSSYGLTATMQATSPGFSR